MEIGPDFLPIKNSLYESREEYFSGRNFVEKKPIIKLYNFIKSVTVNRPIPLGYLHRNHGSQPAFTCSKLTIETLEHGMKYVQIF